MTSLELLSSDIIEDDFFKVFKPIYWCQVILGSVRINYKYKFICRPSRWQKLYALFTLCIYIYSIHHVLYDIEKFNSREVFLFKSIRLFSSVFMVSALILNNAFVHPNCNVSIYVILQNVDRALMVCDKQFYNKMFRRSLIWCVLLAVFYFTWFLGMIRPLFGLDIAYYDAFVTFFMFTYQYVEDLETLSFIHFLYFLCKRLENINSMMEERINIKYENDVRYSDYHEKLNFRRLLEAYRGIAEAFNLLQKLYNAYILILLMYTFMSILLFVKQLITIIQYINILAAGQFILLFTKICSRPLFMGTYTEMFLSQIRRSICNCYLLLDSHDNEVNQKHLKNILRILKVRMQPFSVYGMFALDARLPLGLLALTTTYTVVLLQFEFLS